MTAHSEELVQIPRREFLRSDAVRLMSSRTPRVNQYLILPPSVQHARLASFERVVDGPGEE
jgi:hypothetical protein